MNKQTEKLISADKLLEGLKKELAFCIKEKFNEKNTRFYLGRETVLMDIIKRLESGAFDPDPIPLPTLNLGDKVKYSKLFEPVTLVWIGKDTAVIQDYIGNNHDVFIRELEPIKEVQEDVR